MSEIVGLVREEYIRTSNGHRVRRRWFLVKGLGELVGAPEVGSTLHDDPYWRCVFVKKIRDAGLLSIDLSQVLIVYSTRGPKEGKASPPRNKDPRCPYTNHADDCTCGGAGGDR